MTKELDEGTKILVAHGHARVIPYPITLHARQVSEMYGINKKEEPPTKAEKVKTRRVDRCIIL